MAAGFVSVRVYLTRTAENLTASAGAALGAMTWLWLFLVEAASVAFGIFTARGREIFKEAMKRPELTQIADDPQKFIAFFVLALLIFLVIGSASAALGGILAVRWQPKSGPSH
jgi:hypothetical protein